MTNSPVVRNILLVTGSRVLCELDEVHQKPLRRHLARYMTSADVVVFGDAAGPDAWAYEIALACGMLLSRWCSHAPYAGRVLGIGPDWWGLDGLDHKARDRAMVDWWADKAKELHLRLACLALRASWSETDGTGNTLRMAARRAAFCSMFTVEQDGSID